MNRTKSGPFYDVLDTELKPLHDEKGEAYEGSSETYANYRKSAKWSKAIVANPDQLPMIYAMMRADEKMERFRNILEGANPGSESLEDTLKDLAIIPVIGLLLYREGREEYYPNPCQSCKCGTFHIVEGIFLCSNCKKPDKCRHLRSRLEINGVTSCRDCGELI